MHSKIVAVKAVIVNQNELEKSTIASYRSSHT